MLTNRQRKNLDDILDYIFTFQDLNYREKRLDEILKKLKNDQERRRYLKSKCLHDKNNLQIWLKIENRRIAKMVKQKENINSRIGRFNEDFIDQLDNILSERGLRLQPKVSYFKNSFFTFDEILINERIEAELNSMGIFRIKIGNKRGWGCE